MSGIGAMPGIIPGSGGSGGRGIWGMGMRLLIWGGLGAVFPARFCSAGACGGLGDTFCCGCGCCIWGAFIPVFCEFVAGTLGGIFCCIGGCIIGGAFMPVLCELVDGTLGDMFCACSGMCCEFISLLPAGIVV